MDRAVELALSKGATEAEVYNQRIKTRQIEFTNEEKKVKTTISQGMGLRIAFGKRLGLYATTLRPGMELEEAVERAVKIARVSPENPEWRHFNESFSQSNPNRIYDEGIAKLTYEDLLEEIDHALDIIRDYDERVKPTSGILSISVAETIIANSHNQPQSRWDSVSAFYITAKGEEGKRESSGSEGSQERNWEELSIPDLAQAAAKKALDSLEARTMEGGEIPVILRNKVFSSILGVMLSQPINADNVQKGSSPFAEKLGERVAGNNFTLIDDGNMDGGMGSTLFDDEGTRTQQTPVIQEGILQNFLYDNYTALKENKESTGNANRASYGSTPNPAPTNLILTPGDWTMEEEIRETQHGIYISDVIGEWLSNPISGELNATITHGYLIEKGEITQPVKGMVLAGNFHQLMKEQITAIAQDTDHTGNNYSPTVKIQKLTLSGE
jgi:PmbA protein